MILNRIMTSFQLELQESFFSHISLQQLVFDPIPPVNLIPGTYLRYQAKHHDLQKPMIYHFTIQYDTQLQKTILSIDIENVMYQNSIEWKFIYIWDIKWESVLYQDVETFQIILDSEMVSQSCQKSPFRIKWKVGLFKEEMISLSTSVPIQFKKISSSPP